DAAPALAPLSVLAALVLGVSTVVATDMAWWLAPVALPLLLSWPLAVWAASPRLGRMLRRFGLLLTPEELAPSPTLRRAWSAAASDAVPATADSRMAANAARLKIAA
ncbi:MAG: hypothetical protein M3Y32_09320, partial [Pseudomonadota bacterium]|nr:hypothetical protein [Pseudomonadota bacterium]